jgi:tRNA(Ile)-lysidine synthase
MLVDKVRATISRYRMIEPGDKVLVALSGGPDSTALFHLLLALKDELSFSLFVAHLNHQLRGKEAEEDALFVRRLASEKGIPFKMAKVDVGRAALEQGLSLEEAARVVRYNFLFSLKKKLKMDKIAVGHTKNDQAETFLMRLIRGSGLAGLSAIYPTTLEGIIRPLIDVTRREIIDYLEGEGISYRIDSSNYDLFFMRNRVRRKLIPYLEEQFNPDMVNTLSRVAEVSRADDGFLSELARARFSEIASDIENGVSLDITRFLELPLSLKRRILRLAFLRVKGELRRLSYYHIDSIISLAERSEGKRLCLPRGIVAIKEGGAVIIREKEEVEKVSFRYILPVPGEAEIIELCRHFRTRVISREQFEREGRVFSSAYAALDRSKLSSLLEVRNRQPGDYFKPLGQGGGKKLKDFFIGRRVPARLRDTIPLFISDGDIAWIAGVEIGDRFKIMEDTREITLIEEVF